MTKKAVNFMEWLFIRRSAVAWGISSSHDETILKNELLDAAYLVMLPFN
jgi:hypothetical protein